MGFDTIAAQTVINLQKEYPHIKLILVIPCNNQTKGWSEKDIVEYERIKEKASDVIYTSDHYYNGCMHKRNRYLVDNSSVCICYLKNTFGGTFYTVNYAKKNSKIILNIYQYNI